MAVITTKYSIGDVVYCAGVVTERKRHPCPDCNNTGKWKAFSPAGGEYSFGCPRCSASYIQDRDLSLDYSAYVPSVNRLTIGSVQVNTAPGAYDHGNRYMCRETGVGSGSVYDEKDLYETEEQATVASQAMADASNASVDWIVKQYNKSLAVSDYQLENAALKEAKDLKSRAGSVLWNLSDLFNKIEEAQNKDEILEAVQDYKTYDWARDKEKVAP